METNRISGRLAKVESALVPDPTTTPANILVPWVMAHLELPLDWLDYVCRMDDFTLEILTGELYLQGKTPPLPDLKYMSDHELQDYIKTLVPSQDMGNPG